MTPFRRVATLLVEVAVGLVVATVLIGTSFGVMRVLGCPLGQPVFGVMTVTALVASVGALVLRRGGALRGPRD
jgi:hypothetical protein